MPCSFCGSDKVKVETPYIDRVTGEHKTTICCQAQRKNQEYQKKHFHPIHGEKPPMESVEKL